MAISDFYFLVFDPQKSKVRYFQNSMPKNMDIRKAEIYIIDLCTANMCTQCQTNIFIFACAVARKPSNANDVTFETRFLEFPVVARQNK